MASVDYDSVDYEEWNQSIYEYGEEMTAPVYKETLPTYVIFMLVLYTIIFIVGFFGNCIVIYGVMQQGLNKTTSSFFIANLALSDLAVLVLSLPVGLLQELASWPFGELAWVAPSMNVKEGDAQELEATASIFCDTSHLKIKDTI
ncbi:Neuropeptide FF receptor 2 [Exaiptasia diaphana]|nr:Neuropeptide FF receptor 2 [Exaiptasia diaphana]